jgi:hypothetical protein
MWPRAETSAIALTIVARGCAARHVASWHARAHYAKLYRSRPVQQGESMPAARRSASKSTARSGAGTRARSGSSTRARSASTTRARSGAGGVRARASATSSATRREVEQSIARFEKRLDDANDALQALGKHLGRGAQSSYKEVTAALRTLRRDASKTNKQALKEFDKLRGAVTQARATASRSATSKSRSSAGTARSTSRSSASRASGSRASSSRASTSRASGSRSTASRSTASKSRSTSSRSGGTRSSSSRAKKS